MSKVEKIIDNYSICVPYDSFGSVVTTGYGGGYTSSNGESTWLGAAFGTGSGSAVSAGHQSFKGGEDW